MIGSGPTCLEQPDHSVRGLIARRGHPPRHGRVHLARVTCPSAAGVPADRVHLGQCAQRRAAVDPPVPGPSERHQDDVAGTAGQARLVHPEPYLLQMFALGESLVYYYTRSNPTCRCMKLRAAPRSRSFGRRNSGCSTTYHREPAASKQRASTRPSCPASWMRAARSSQQHERAPAEPDAHQCRVPALNLIASIGGCRNLP